MGDDDHNLVNRLSCRWRRLRDNVGRHAPRRTFLPPSLHSHPSARIGLMVGIGGGGGGGIARPDQRPRYPSRRPLS